jgi:NAD(P)-dependent dehydrogenase (short-subunit alcohol dehydrogenase family)
MWLGSHGATVVVNNRAHPGTPSSAARVVDEIIAKGGRALPDEHSVADEAGVGEMVNSVIDRFGRIDIVVCNAGVVNTLDTADLDMTAFRDLMEINFWGSIYPVAAALPSMIRKKYGRIVMSVSVAALYGANSMPHYAASRSAIIGFARSVALDVKEAGDIRVNMISPSALTNMTLRGAMPDVRIDPDLQSPSKVAPVVGWMCSDACQQSGLILHSGQGRVRRIRIVGGPVLDFADDVGASWALLEHMTGTTEDASAAEAAHVLRPELRIVASD